MGPGRSAAACAKVSGRREGGVCGNKVSQYRVKPTIHGKMDQQLPCQASFFFLPLEVELVQRRMAGKLQKLLRVMTQTRFSEKFNHPLTLLCLNCQQ